MFHVCYPTTRQKPVLIIIAKSLTAPLVAPNSAAQTVVIQWVPADCDISSNDRADRLVHDGGSKEQHAELVSFDESKTFTKTPQHKQWQLQHPASCPNDSYHLLTLREQVKIFRLRTGHNRLNHHHLHTQFGIGQTGDVSLQHGTADSRPHTQDMPNVRSCPRQHLAITHKLGEETLRFTGGSSGNGCIHPRDWVRHLNRDEWRRRK